MIAANDIRLAVFTASPAFCDWVQRFQVFFHSSVQTRWDKYKDKKKRSLSICSKLLLYYTLENLGIKLPDFKGLRYCNNGAAQIEGLSVEFNLSYHQHTIAIVVAKQAVGVDLEGHIRNRKFNRLPSFIQDRLAQCQIHQWNELEACAKYCKRGLGMLWDTQIPSAIQFKHIALGEEMDCCIAYEHSASVQLQKVTEKKLANYINKIKGDDQYDKVSGHLSALAS